MISTDTAVERAYQLARERYESLGVDVGASLDTLARVPVSLHCWQGDDVGGFENTGSELGGGLAVTGNYPGKARTPDELRADLDKALSLIPGTHRLNLHACYAETGGKKVERTDLGPEHFARWLDWAKAKGMGLDFNHPYRLAVMYPSLQVSGSQGPEIKNSLTQNDTDRMACQYGPQ